LQQTGQASHVGDFSDDIPAGEDCVAAGNVGVAPLIDERTLIVDN
jgi:hypothetical protein